jgi:hypothetical protein
MVETDAPQRLADALIGERLHFVVGSLVCSVVLALLLSQSARIDANVLVMAGFVSLGLVWSLWSLLRDVPFFTALPPLLRTDPVRMRIEIHAEQRGEEEGRFFQARLTGPEGERLALDLGSSFPAWVLSPGVEVDVFRSGSGPVAFRSLRGDVYAVPEGRVSR